MANFKVLISDPLPAEAQEILQQTGSIDVIVELENYEPLLPEIDGWIIRSGTKINAAHFEQAGKLRCVCRAGAGVDNVDLEAATRHGVVVMNTPDSNSMAAAEQAVALLMAVARNIPQAHHTMAGGGWDRKKYVGVEVEGKSVGVIGLGKIGRIAARKLKGLGMRVYGYDPFVSEDFARDLGIELKTVEELLSTMDFLTLHVPLNDDTRGLIGAKELATAKPGLRIVNCSRGGIIDEQAVVEAMDKDGPVAGVALDVFTSEPPPEDSPLRDHPKIVTTPHLGASTVEAQQQVATVSADQIRDMLIDGTVNNAVNTVSLAGEALQQYGPMANLAHRLGFLHAKLLEGQPRRFCVVVEEELLEKGVDRLIVDSALAGFLSATSDRPVNTVNARYFASERGLEVSVRGATRGQIFTHSVRVEIANGNYERSLEGAVIWHDSLRLVRLDDFVLDGDIEGPILLTGSNDRPGMLGELGRVLGELGANIANMSLGRNQEGGQAVAILNLDEEPDAKLVDAVQALDGVLWAKVIS